jgi:hypothetical protein
MSCTEQDSAITFIESFGVSKFTVEVLGWKRRITYRYLFCASFTASIYRSPYQGVVAYTEHCFFWASKADRKTSSLFVSAFANLTNEKTAFDQVPTPLLGVPGG